MTKSTNRFMGRTLIKNLKRLKKNRNLWVDSENLAKPQETYNLSSCIEENDLQRLMSKAENEAVQFEINSSRFATSGQAHINLADNFYVRIPRRPSWDMTMTADDFHHLEASAFLEWRRNIAKTQEKIEKHNEAGNSLTLTPFEKNIEVWRQLWLVIERSDILVQIVDSRNPLFYRNTDLELYIREISSNSHSFELSKKPTNKINSENLSLDKDLPLVSNLDQSDKTTNNENDTNSTLEADSQQSNSQESDYSNDEYETDSGDITEEDSTSDLDNSTKDKNIFRPPNHTYGKEPQALKMHKKLNLLLINKSDYLSFEQRKTWATALETMDGNDTNGLYHITKSAIKEALADPDILKRMSSDIWALNKTVFAFFSAKYSAEMASADVLNDDDDVLMPTDFLDLMNILKWQWENDIQQQIEDVSELSAITRPQLFNVGFVGYPNVGKSSTINALLGAKKVAVSATPGKTKHFQTHLLTTPDYAGICLCDCPGLVMPNFVMCGKAELIANGILPIDTVTDPFTPVELIINLFGTNREPFKTYYGLKSDDYEIDHEIYNDGNNLSRALLTAHSKSRGFTTSLGQPDFHHSARIILKDFINGQLLYCHPPPDTNSEQFKLSTRIPHKHQNQTMRKRFPQLLKPSTDTIIQNSRAEKDLDAKFFKHNNNNNGGNIKLAQKMQLLNSKNDIATMESLTIKDINPNKRHFIKHKHEKLRRLAK